jgi:hypothetical protein
VSTRRALHFGFELRPLCVQFQNTSTIGKTSFDLCQKKDHEKSRQAETLAMLAMLAMLLFD